MTRQLFRRLMAALIFLAVVFWGLWHFDIPQILWLPTPYICETKGYSYRYKDGVRLNESIPEHIRFELTTFQYASRFKIEEDNIFKEHQNSKIVYNKAGSSSVEDLYLYDATDPSTNERTQTSLVFNTTSGDIRLMHHRWIPPNGWQNSDLYFFSGFCLKKSFD